MSPAGFPYSFPIAFTGTSVETMRTNLSKEVGDIIFGTNSSTTTAAGNAGGTTLVDSSLTSLPQDWFRTGTGGEQPTYIKITSGTYDTKTKPVSAFDNTTGTVTVAATFGGQIDSSVTYEVHRLCHPDLKDTMIAFGAKDAYPYVYDYVDSTCFVFGDCLLDGSFEAWSNSTTPAYYTASSVTTTRSSTYTWGDSEYSCALSTTTGYIEQTIGNQNALNMLGGTKPTYYARVLASTASQVRLALYDGTTITYGDYHTGGGAWELLDVTATLADNPTTVSVRVYYDSTATTAYVDDGHCIDAYDKYDYDISNLALVNDTPEQIYTISEQECDTTYPRPSGAATVCNAWKMLPNGYIRFTQNLGHGTRLRIVGKKYLTARDATTVTVAAGASFLDLDDTDDTSYTGKATYVVQVNATETGLELAASAASQHALGSSTAHSADTLANITALCSDLTIASTTDIATHAADTTSHGVSSGAIAGTGDITTHSDLTTGVHGITGTVIGTEDIDDTAGGTSGATTSAASSNALYGHTSASTGHSATGAVVGTTNTQTLTLKTLTTPVIASIYQDAGKTQLMTLPNTASDTLAAIAATQELTNKTVTAAVAKGTWTSSSWVVASHTLGNGETLAIGDATYYPCAIVSVGAITEDWETSTLFDAAAVTDTKLIWTSPAKCRVKGFKMRLTEQFAGTGLTDLSIEVGIGGGDVDAYLDDDGAMNLTSDALNSVYNTQGASWDSSSGLLHCAAATGFTATATATGCNLADLTAGTVVFYVAYEKY